MKMPDIPIIPFSQLCLVAELNPWKLIYFLLDWACTDLNEILQKENKIVLHWSLHHCIEIALDEGGNFTCSIIFPQMVHLLSSPIFQILSGY